MTSSTEENRCARVEIGIPGAIPQLIGALAELQRERAPPRNILRAIQHASETSHDLGGMAQRGLQIDRAHVPDRVPAAEWLIAEARRVILA